MQLPEADLDYHSGPRHHGGRQMPQAVSLTASIIFCLQPVTKKMLFIKYHRDAINLDMTNYVAIVYPDPQVSRFTRHLEDTFPEWVVHKRLICLSLHFPISCLFFQKIFQELFEPGR